MKKQKILYGLIIISLIIFPITSSVFNISNVSGYGSQNSHNVHGRIIECSLELLEKYGYSAISNYIKNTKVNGQLTALDQLTAAQDRIDDPEDDGVEIWDTCTHFWDPDDKCGMIFVANDAVDSCSVYFNYAVEKYLEGYEALAFTNLGYALHYLQDVTVPYHCASDWIEAGCPIIGPKPHVAYEHFVEHFWGEFDLSEPTNRWVTDIINNPTVTIDLSAKKYWNDKYHFEDLDWTAWGWVLHDYDYSGAWVHNAAVKGKSYLDSVDNNQPTYTGTESEYLDHTITQEWVTAAIELVQYCTSITAGFLTLFWQLTNPAYFDIDNDGLSCEEEIRDYLTSYTDYDTDSDGMDDGYEVINSLDPLLNDADEDPDGDNLINVDEYTWTTNPHDLDTDQDGLWDGEEKSYWLSKGFGPTSDIDNDGYTNIHDFDSDDDTLSDYHEIYTYNLYPYDFDSDSDDFDDASEYNYWISRGLSPQEATFNCKVWDADGDYIRDGYEVNIYNTDPLKKDTDYDGLDDKVEIDLETNPCVVDSDGDGWGDGSEVLIYYTDPNDPNDYPDTPLPITGFNAISDGRSRLTFTWNQPSNWVAGWYYKLYIKINGVYNLIRTTSISVFMYIPPNAYTVYEYRVICYNNLNTNLHSPYSYWTGAVSGGGGFF